jgi:chorismate dehydratase
MTGRPDSPRSRTRLGAVAYLNARPLVFGLEASSSFDVRFDLPSRCATLLHDGAIDVGLIPSIEYWRTPGTSYSVVPGVSIASNGPVASVCLYAAKPMRDVRSIALDTSSRTSAALVRVLCERLYAIDPALEPQAPDLDAMLARSDAALVIGDKALFAGDRPGLLKVDLGQAWTDMTGLPFVWAFWAGRTEALSPAAASALQAARDEGVRRPDEIARRYCPDRPADQATAAAYLRTNIKYDFGPSERAGLALFAQYAAAAGLVGSAGELQFYGDLVRG